MILCASPDPKELHKTIATLEYGAKAKCIVRGQHTPIKDKGAEDSSSAVILGSRIAALDQFICKLQMENKTREKEQNQAQKELSKKEEEVSLLKARLALAERRGVEVSEEEINSKVNERTQRLKSELERKIQECEKMANELVEMERRKMEEKIFQQQQEVEMLRQRLEEIECELRLSRAGSSSSVDMEGGSFMKKLMQVCSEDSDMVKSMDLDKSLDLETKVIYNADINGATALSGYPFMNSLGEEMYSFSNKRCLTTVYEEEECDEDEDKNSQYDDEVQKEVIEEKQMIVTPDVAKSNQEKPPLIDTAELQGLRLYDDSENTEDAASSRQLRIQNIFTLCGNYRELSQHSNTPTPATKTSDNNDFTSDPSQTNAEDAASRMINDISQLKNSISKDFVVSDILDVGEADLGKLRGSGELAKNLEDHNPLDESSNNIEVYVKWEASKENQGKFITTLKVSKDSTLADLRKLIEKHLGGDQQAFTFLALGVCPTGHSYIVFMISRFHLSLLLLSY